LISGHDIYKEATDLKATFFLTLAGLIAFLFSPISFIILLSSTENYSYNIIKIFNFNIILLFVETALGLGLVFGYLTILDFRLMFLCWIREITQIHFWIDTYETVWDDFFNSLKKGAEILVETINNEGKKEELHCFLKECSIRNQEKELHVESNNSQTLILKNEIARVTAPNYSFKKHFETVDHIGQSFYCVMISIGFFILSFVSLKMSKYIMNDINDFPLIYDLLNNIDKNSDALINSSDVIGNFYSTLSISLLIISITFLAISVMLARSDFSTKWAYLSLCPDFIILFIILAPLFSLVTLYGVDLSYVHWILVVFIYICIRNIIRYPVYSSLKKITKEFGNDELLTKFIDCFYLYYPLNEQSSIRKIFQETKMYQKFNKNEANSINNLINKIEGIKHNKSYLNKEDANILLNLKRLIK
jgi:CII-binding regulator of phage lambda lysogenization HflD